MEKMLRKPAQEQMVENDGDKWHQSEMGRQATDGD
jgi:hypothetical protein